MRHLTTRLAFATLLALSSAGLGCDNGGSDSGPGSGPAVDRISRQDWTNDAGTLIRYWTYTYDAFGRCTMVRAYGSAGDLAEVTSHSFANGVRSEAITRDPGGALLRSTTYTWTGGVLSRATFRGSNGAVTDYSTFEFAAGRKLTTYHYTGADVYMGRADFTYDPVTGARTGSTTYDANDVVTGSSTRTYTDGLFAQADLISGSTAHRIFTYERGPLDEDLDVFFEF